MKFTSFVDLSHRVWDEYFTRIYAADLLGDLDSRGGVILYPKLLLCTETSTHHIAELIGAVPNYQGLVIKTHRDASTVRYLSQFTDQASDPAVRLPGARHQLVGLTLSQGVAIDTITARFPFAHLYRSILHRAGGTSAVIDFTDDFKSCVLENCVLVNRFAAAVRVKHILLVAVVSRAIPEFEYEDFLRKDVLVGAKVRGVHTVSKGESQDFAVAGQFASLYLLPGLRETTIGEFLRQHPAIIQRALGARRFIYEPIFEWRDEQNSSGDTAINPDLLVQRDDGFFDIYDLKTAALSRESITQGPRRRRRFIDYVNDGIAQLAHYREYFTHEANAHHALEKYGVRVKDPALVLVVGNFDNAHPREIEEASRMLSGISMLDYDSFLQLFLRHRPHGTTASPR